MTKVISAEQKQNTKRYSTQKLKKLMTTTALAAAGMVMISSQQASALPQGEQVVGGNVTYDRSVANKLTANQTTQQAYTLWDTFDTSANETVKIKLPNASALSVNKVTGSADTNGTQFDGILSSNGNVWILDQNGVFFGATARVDVGGLVASTGSVSVEDVMDGDGKFTFENFGDGQVVNHGTMNIAEAGLAAFVAPHAANRGVINARLGTVALAGGDKVTIDMYGDGLYEIALEGQAADALIENTGTINAEGGTIIMTADAAKDAVDNIVNMTGVAKVASATVKGGKIVLSGGSAGVVNVDGDLDASGSEGGDINVTGQNVLVSENATISADGGKDSDGNGNGGNIYIIGENAAIFRGNLFARGGDNGGNGGFVETSGLNYIELGGNVDTSAADGYLYGTWLIDPLDMRIRLGRGDTSGDGEFSNWRWGNGSEGSLGNGGVSTIYESEIEGQNSNITIQARRNIWVENGNVGTYGGTLGDGTIQLKNNRNLTIETRNDSSNGTINLTTSSFGNNLLFKTTGTGDITIRGSYTGNRDGNIILSRIEAGRYLNVYTDEGDITITNTLTSGSDMYINSGNDGGDWTQTNGANLVLNAGGFVHLADRVQTGGGDVSVNAGSYFWNSDDIVTGGGDASIRANALYIDDALNAGAGSVVLARTTDGIIDVGDSQGSSFRVDQSELNRITASSLSIGSDIDPHTTDIRVANANLTAFDTVSLNALAASSITFSDIASFGNLVANADSIFVNAALSATGINFNAVDGGTGSITIGDVVTTAGGDANLNTDNFSVGAGGGIFTLGGTVNLTTDTAIVDGQLNTLNGIVNVMRQTAGRIALGDFGPGLHLDNSELGNITADNLNVGSANATTINVANVDLDHIEDVSLNAFKNEQVVNFSGSNDFDNVDANAGSTINVLGGSVNADTNINFDAPTVNLSGDLNAPSITGSAATVNVQTTSADIQDGVDVAANGANIDVAAGAFAEGVVVDKDGLTITGANAGIDANTGARGAETIVLPGLSTGFTINGNGVSVDGFTVIGGIFGFGTTGANTTVQNNIVTGSISHGFVGSTGSATVSGNRFDSVNGDGIFMTAMTSASVSNNVIDGADGDGIDITNSSDVSISGNTIDDAEQNGIDVSNLTGTNSIADNTVNGNDEQTGISAGNSVNLTIDNNTVDDFETGIDVDGGSNVAVTNNTATSVEYGVMASGTADLTVSGNSLFGNSVTGIGLDGTDGAVVDGNDVHDFETGISVENSAQAKVTSNTVDNSDTGIVADNAANLWIYDNDVTNSAVTGIHVKNSDGTGYGGGANGDVDIWRNRVSSLAGATGILVEDSNYATIGVHNNNLFGPDGLPMGNVVSGGANAVVVNNSTNAMVRFNTIDNVTGEGVDVNNSANSTVADNQISNVGSNGVSLNPSAGSTVNNNTITNVGTNGVFVLGSDNVDVTNNTVSGAVTGVRSENSDNINVTGNTVDNVSGEGVIATAGSDNAQVNSNSISNTGSYGVLVDQNAQSVNSNTIWNTGNDAIEVSNSSGVTVNSNLIGTLGGADNINGEGIDVNNSSLASINGNTVNETASNGISINPSPNAIISGNSIFNAGENGISVLGSDDAHVLGNLVDGTGHNGISVKDSAGVKVDTGNTVTNTSSAGIAVNNSVNTTVDANNVSNTGGSGVWLKDANGSTVSNNVIENTWLNGSRNTGAGVYVRSTDGITVIGNTIDTTNLGGDGVEVNDSTSVVISTNLIGTLGGVDNISGEGIDVNNSPGTQISSNTVTETVSNGISINPSDNSFISNNNVSNAGANGIQSTDSDFVTIIANTVSNSAQDGIRINGGTIAFVQTNNVTGSGQDGVHANGAEGLFVTSNQISNSGSDGVELVNVNSSALLVNTISASTANGIKVDGGENAHIIENNVTDSGVDGIHVNNVATNAAPTSLIGYSTGTYADAVNDVAIRGNTVTTAGDEGIDVNNTPGVEITENTVSDTVSNGISLNPSPGSLIKDNTIFDIGGNGIDVLGSDTVTIDNNDIDNVGINGIKVVDSDDVNITNNEVDDAVVTGINVLNSNDTQITDNEINDNGASTYVDYGILVNGGNSADVDRNKVEETNVAGIAALNTTRIDIDDNTVKDGKGDGIFVENGNRADIRRNTVQDHADDGVDVKNHHTVEVRNNTVLRSTDSGITVRNNSHDGIVNANDVDVATNGIRVTNSNNVEVSDNTVDDASDKGIWSRNSDDTQILRNEINDNGASTFVDYGILVDGGNSVDVDQNKVEESTIAGIAALNTTRTDIDDNLVKDGKGDGILIENGSRADVRRNTVLRHDKNGVSVTDHNQLEVKNNTITDSGIDGIVVVGGRGATIFENTVSKSGDDGVDVFDNKNVDVDGNTITESADEGIQVRFSGGVDTSGEDVSIRNNTVTDADDNGIWVENGFDIAVFSNDVTDTEGHGIYVQNSPDAYVSWNNVTDADKNGIYVAGSNDTDIFGNVIVNSGWNGILVNPSESVEIFDNEVSGSGSHGIRVEGGSDHEIHENDVFGTSLNGISLWNTGTASVHDNLVLAAGEKGIASENGEFTNIRNNIVALTGSDGIFTTDVLLTNVAGNLVGITGGNGISVYGGDLYDGYFTRIANNKVIGTYGSGIAVDGIHGGNIYDRDEGFGLFDYYGPAVRIIGNEVALNGMHGISVMNSGATRIRDNSVFAAGLDFGNIIFDGGFIYEPPFVGIEWGNGNGIHVENVYSYGDVRPALASEDGEGSFFDVVIRDNRVGWSGGHGIYTNWTGNHNITNNNVRFSGIDATGWTFDTLGEWFYGLISNGEGVLEAGARALFGQRNMVTFLERLLPEPDITFFDSHDGIHSRNFNYGLVTGNTVRRSGDDGIEQSYGNAVIIAENTVRSSGFGVDEDIPEDDDRYEGREYAGDEYGADGIFVYQVGRGYNDDRPVARLLPNTASAILEGGFGYYTNGWSVRVLNNDVRTSGDDGIEVLHSGATQVDGNTVVRTGLATYDESLSDIINTQPYYNGSNDGDGIHVAHVYHNDYFGNAVEITNNNIRHTGDDGIDGHWNGVTLVGWNTIRNAGFGQGEYYYGGDEGWGHDGIHIGQTFGPEGNFTDPFGEHAVKIIGNTVNTTADDGIQVHMAGRTLVAGNNVSHAGYGDDFYYGYGDEHGADGIVVHHIHNNDDFYPTLAGRNEDSGYYGYAVDIIDNTVNTTADDGIEVFHADSTYIANNDVDNAGYGGGSPYPGSDDWGADGIHVRMVHGGNYGPGLVTPEGFTEYAVVVDNNDVNTTGDEGIQTYETGRTRISDNEVRNADDNGIEADHSYHVEILDNYVANSGDDGIDADHISGDLTLIIDGNESHHNGDDGIDVDWSYNVFINNNTTYNNYDDGIDVNGGNHVEITNNRSFNNGYYDRGEGPRRGERDFETQIRVSEEDCCYNEDSNGIEAAYVGGVNTLIIEGNIVHNNRDDGVEVDNSAHVEILDNEIFDNGDDGIDVDDVYSYDTLIIADNIITGNEDDGIVVRNSMTTEVIDNIINNNGSNGLFMQGPRNMFITVSGNEFTNNPVGARFESGVIDLTGPGNRFVGGDVAMQFAPAPSKGFEDDFYPQTATFLCEGFCPAPSPIFAPMELVGDTIGSQFFRGQSTFFVELDNGAFFDPGRPTRLDATDSTYVTPFGTVRPSDTNDLIGADVFDFLESRFFHFVDDRSLGLFFFGDILSPEVNQEDIFRQFGAFDPFDGPLQFTLNGLPIVDGNIALTLNALSPAGGEGEDGTSAEELAGIEPAAGGDEGQGEGEAGSQETNCLGDAADLAGAGYSTTVTFGTGIDSVLNAAANCESDNI